MAEILVLAEHAGDDRRRSRQDQSDAHPYHHEYP